jgi:LemA protein
MKKTLIVLAILAAVIGSSLIGTYNSLVTQSQTVDNQWAQVETQYQRRFDLIPNLVEATKGIFEQEQEVFGKIAEARQGYAGAQTPDEKAKAAAQVESALARLLVIVENYPQLRSSENVTGLMDELAGTENRVSVERKRYNDQVRTYNTQVKRFPTNFIAPIFGFNERSYFEAVEAAEEAPTVDFGNE